MGARELGAKRAQLARQLEAARAPRYMIWRAWAGVYDDFQSDRVNAQTIDLTRHLEQIGLPELARRARQGEFD